MEDTRAERHRIAVPPPEGAHQQSPYDRAIAMIAGTVTTPNPTVADIRAGYERMLAELPIPDGLSIVEDSVGGVRCLRVRATDTPVGSMLMLHGGGYVMGSAHGYRGFAGVLALETGLEIVVCDYRLAPEHPFPAALDDAGAVYLELIEEYGARNTLVLGDSAGGGLATGLLLTLRDSGLPQPRCAVLICPELDLTASSESMERNRHRDPVLRQASILRHGSMYLAGRDPRATVYASPHWDPCDQLPPLLILTTDSELFHDEAIALAQRVNESAGTATLSNYPGMFHVWPLFWSFLPEGRQAVTEIAGYIAMRLGTPGGRES
ncbi:alpha/beta hydrolase fold domain-containing protein [Mycobacterium sp. C31M]